MQIPITTLCLPLFFVTAWVMSNRNLSDKLRYKLPLYLRWQCPCIQRFWVYDLLFSSLALPIAIVATQYAVWKLFRNAGELDGQEQFSMLLYPLSFVMLGFFWPRLATIKVSIGEEKTSMTSIGIGQLRDYFLGGPMIISINNSVQREVESYVDRVITGVAASPGTFENCIRQVFGLTWHDYIHPTAENLEELRQELLKRAQADFESLYCEICRVQMVPLIDRTKPLMKVAQMTNADEQILYELGIRGVRQLCFAGDGPIGGLSAARVRLLRNNARGLVFQRFKFGTGFVVIAVGITIAGSLSAALYQKPLPRAGGQKSVEEVRRTGAYQ